jgi:ABC-type ATPase involved in cell division
LDGTFPRRVLSQTPPGPEVTDELIRERYLEQTQLRETLNEISVLDDQDDLPLPGGKLEPWQRRVLWIYLEDSERKLLTFRDLLDRITLLREIVNSRFLNKTLIVDRDKGFRFETKLGQQLDPTQLSSGEQNELVLVYNLLFKVSEGSVVLIDEPEISLHIAWQQKFLEDVQRISQISHLRFIIATHSPQIVHKWWSRAVALGPGLDPEDQLV